MRNNSEIEIELLLKYLSGLANEREMEAVINWLSDDEKNRKYYSEIKQIWIESELALQKDDYKLDENYTRLMFRIKSCQQEDTRLNLKNRARQSWLTFYKAAAIIMALISLSVTILYLSGLKKEIPVFSYNEIVIPYGSKSSIELSDGTKIWLNSGSKLRYPDRFVGDKRAVFLEGEAFFEVKPNKNSMFVVNTSQLNVKVYGTKFNVKCFPGEKSIETALLSGSIELEKIGSNGETTKSIKMRPHEIVTYSKDDDKFILLVPVSEAKTIDKKRSVDLAHINPIQPKTVEIVSSWKDNKLTFRSDSINVLTEKLQRWYNVNIDLKADDLKKYTFTGTFTTETIEQALNYLQLTTPFSYQIDKNNITINTINKRNL